MEFQRIVRRDAQELVGFYLDEEHRARMARMKPIRRFWYVLWWLLKGLFRKLSPVRRTLFVISLVCLGLGDFSFHGGETDFSVNFYIPSAVILLFILMLELKDKLVAHGELQVGRAVQLALLPDRNPILAGWQIWLMSRPAHDVGGDLADYLHLDDTRLGIALGDVAGKGLGAALLMAKLQATLRTIAPDCISLSELGAKLNRIFCRDCVPGRFATMVYIELAERTGRVRVLNAGHPTPIAVRPDALADLPPAALPIGILADTTFPEQSLELEHGDFLLLYSDGLTEARNREGVFFGEERLRALLARIRSMPIEVAGSQIVDAVEQFVGDARMSDDLSMVLLRRE